MDSPLILNRLIEKGYRALRASVWSSPLIRYSSVSNAAIRLGYFARHWLRLAPHREAIGVVLGHKMWFGPASECYLDMTMGTWEPGVTRLFETFLEPGMVVVDVGAHIGYFTLLAARQVGPKGRVYAFEPAPDNYALLIKNIELNGFQHIVPARLAVSNRDGTTKFFLHPDSVAHSLHAHTFGRPSGTIDVAVTTLDRFFETAGWPPIDLVKLDIEGAEPAALEGMKELLARNRSIRLVIEYIPRILACNGGQPFRLLDVLCGLGFRVRMVPDKGGLLELSDRLLGDTMLRTELWCERIR